MTLLATALCRPGIHRWEASLIKNFYFSEKRKRHLQIRTGFFNAPNHPSLTTAAGAATTRNSFRAFTATRDARVLQFALKLYF